MKSIKAILFFIVVTVILISCEDKREGKPDDLISEKEMVDILYDLHVGDAIADKLRSYNPDSIRSNPGDFYQSVLDKHAIADSALARSVLYYSAFPKVYEAIYAKVVDRINMTLEKMKKEEEEAKDKEIQVLEK